jgi:hypothetical protein
MYLSLSQAAKETGKSKSVIANALKNGRISGRRTEQGGWEIDPAELFRVFSPKNALGSSKEQCSTGEEPTQNALLEQEVRHLREQLERERRFAAEKEETIDDLRRRLDQSEAERRETQVRLTALLTHQQEQAKAPEPKAEGGKGALWEKLFGKG